MATLHKAYQDAVDIINGMNMDNARTEDDIELLSSLERILKEHPNLLIYNHRRGQTNRSSTRSNRRISNINRNNARNWVVPLMGVAISLRNVPVVKALIDAGYDVEKRLQFVKNMKMTAYEFVRRDVQENPVGNNETMSAIHTIRGMV